jgi:hypothetical protein
MDDHPWDEQEITETTEDAFSVHSFASCSSSTFATLARRYRHQLHLPSQSAVRIPYRRMEVQYCRFVLANP